MMWDDGNLFRVNFSHVFSCSFWPLSFYPKSKHTSNASCVNNSGPANPSAFGAQGLAQGSRNLLDVISSVVPSLLTLETNYGCVNAVVCNPFGADGLTSNVLLSSHTWIS